MQVVRKYNPQTPIICVEALPTMIGPRAGRWTATAVKELQRQGDKALYYIPLNKDKPLMDDEDYVGDGTHPSKEGSKKIALFLLDKVKNILAEHGKLWYNLTVWDTFIPIFSGYPVYPMSMEAKVHSTKVGVRQPSSNG